LKFGLLRVEEIEVSA